MRTMNYRLDLQDYTISNGSDNRGDPIKPSIRIISHSGLIDGKHVRYPVKRKDIIGDVLDVDFIATVEGQELMNMTDQRLRVEGEILFGLPCPEVQEKFTGDAAE